MVERSLRMREARGSIPRTSIIFWTHFSKVGRWCCLSTEMPMKKNISFNICPDFIEREMPMKKNISFNICPDFMYIANK